MKIYQRSYWGSNSRRMSHERRTYIEGWFGVLKNTKATGYYRGSHQFNLSQRRSQRPLFMQPTMSMTSHHLIKRDPVKPSASMRSKYPDNPSVMPKPLGNWGFLHLGATRPDVGKPGNLAPGLQAGVKAPF